jgi:TolA-binding protein
VDGQRRPALKRFLLYLERYPAGLFHEDALFNAVRLFYKLDKMEEVIRYGGQFVERYPRSGLRSTEVRILYAQGVVAEKQNPEMALRALRPVINRINSISLALQEQAIYLYFHATFKTGNKGVAIQWAEHYLKRFPRGRYVEEAKKIIQ